MINYLTHYYRAGSKPFLSLSSLEVEEALKIMVDLYEDNEMWGRFKNPEHYLNERRKTESWLKKAFMAKGGRPKQDYPIYTVLGISEKIEEKMEAEKIEKIEIPLSLFTEEEVSFTFLDSMYTVALDEQKPEEYYQAQYHGKLFTLTEINAILNKKGLPDKDWWGNVPEDFLPYIEGQVWNQDKLLNFII